MTARELEILNIIYRSGGQRSLRKISQEMGLGPDYTRLISKELLNRRLIKTAANNVFILTASGRSLAGRLSGVSARKKTPTLTEVSRSFGSKVEPPLVDPVRPFINREFMAEQPRLTEHNLGRDLTTEVIDARSIQPSLKRLTQKL